jgi:protein-disulfide isomerase
MAKHKRTRTKMQARPASRRFRRYTRGPALLLAVAVVAAVGVGVLIFLGQATQDSKAIERLDGISAVGRSRGESNAPVTIIEFGDYQCPSCKRFEQTIGGQIEETYIATGRARLEFRNMAFLGDESILAAAAAECANEQDAFWPYHDKLFREQRGENSGNFSFDRLKSFATDLSLDRTAFDECLDSTRTQQMVFDETNVARDAGVDSTPTFFINGEMVKGVKDFGDFQDVIERKLAEAGLAP